MGLVANKIVRSHIVQPKDGKEEDIP